MARFTRNKYPEVIQLDVGPTDGVLNLPFSVDHRRDRNGARTFRLEDFTIAPGITDRAGSLTCWMSALCGGFN
jgi:hypothetical protein